MSKHKSILCTICARGGSKGVKNKNIRHLCSKPLIAYTIEQALAWGKADKVVVSTDSPDIANVARTYGAQVPFMRPARLATDNAPKLDAIRHAVAESEKYFGQVYDIIVDLDATSPFRKSYDLDRCLEKFLKTRAQTLFSVVTAHKNPYFNMVEISRSGFAVLCKKPRLGVVRRQEAPAVFEMNASIYFYRRDYLMDKDNRTPISSRSAVYLMDQVSSYDIDRELDFKFAEFLIGEGVLNGEF